MLDRTGVVNDALNAPFTMAEMKRATGKAGLTSPGKDEVCYVMLAHLSDKVLVLYNRVWEEGKLPGSWEEAVVVPIRKPGKDPTRPTSYRPIALKSHVCKILERRITERVTHFLESRGLVSPHQSGFRKGRGTMDPVRCLELFDLELLIY